MWVVHCALLSLLVLATCSDAQYRGFNVLFHWPGSRGLGYQSTCFGCYGGYRPVYQSTFFDQRNKGSVPQGGVVPAVGRVARVERIPEVKMIEEPTERKSKKKKTPESQNKEKRKRPKPRAGNRKRKLRPRTKEQRKSSQKESLKFIGDFPSLAPIQHPMSGQVYTKGDSTIVVKNFNFTLIGPDAFFWAGAPGSPYPSPAAAPGFPMAFPNPAGKTWAYDDPNMPILPAWGGVDYGEDIVLKLPSGVTVDKISWLAVWCRRYSHNFGHVLFNNQDGNQQENVPTKFYMDGRPPSMYKSFKQIAMGEIEVINH